MSGFRKMLVDRVHSAVEAVLDGLRDSGYSLWRTVTPEEEAANVW